MSDVLSGLRTFFLGDDGLMHEVTSAQSGRYAPVGPWLLGSDVREALRNPTDEQRATAGKALYEAVTRDAGIEPAEWVLLRPKTRRMYEQAACAVLAAAAGGDDE